MYRNSPKEEYGEKRVRERRNVCENLDNDESKRLA
jgi:hypothetical protein